MGLNLDMFYYIIFTNVIKNGFSIKITKNTWSWRRLSLILASYTIDPKPHFPPCILSMSNRIMHLVSLVVAYD
jgi:hypothetical protein